MTVGIVSRTRLGLRRTWLCPPAPALRGEGQGEGFFSAMNKCDRVAGVGAFRETTWLRSRRLQSRLPSGLSELAVLFWRVGKDFFTSLAVCGALEKSCAARWRAVTCWKRLFRRAGGLRRVGKVFFEALEAASGLEKSFSRRWRTNWAWESGLCLRFDVASRLLACGWVVGAGAFRETPDRVAGVESSSPQLLLTLLAGWGQSKTPDSSHFAEEPLTLSPQGRGEGTRRLP